MITVSTIVFGALFVIVIYLYAKYEHDKHCTDVTCKGKWR
jgi:hypothetical protein